MCVCVCVCVCVCGALFFPFNSPSYTDGGISIMTINFEAIKHLFNSVLPLRVSNT